jgi:Sigma-70, region 4
MLRGRRLPLTREEVRDGVRPKTRGDCENGPRPCPWICCRYHLWPDTLGHTNRVAQPPLLEDMAETCALDVAAKGPQRLETIGNLTGVVRERVRQIEERALNKLLRACKREGIEPHSILGIDGE